MKDLCHDQLYQKRMKNAFDKKVYPRESREGDIILKKILPPHNEVPYVVKKAYSKGALVLTTMDGEELHSPVNAYAVKKYFA